MQNPEMQISVNNQISNDILLSIVVPCFNEINTLEEVIQKIKNSPIKNKEIIIVDDYSTDGSREFLEKIKDKNILIKFHKKNKGKAALRTGIDCTEGQVVIIQDADLEYDPEDYPNIINPIIKNKADVVYGSRFKGGQPHRCLFLA